MKKRFLWSEEHYDSVGDTSEAIASLLVDYLCDSDLGVVIGPDGKEYNIEVSVNLVASNIK